MNIEEVLSDIGADLVSEEKCRPFLERLLSERAAAWVDLTSLLRGLGEVEERLRLALSDQDGPVRVTWLDYPESAYGEGYCAIVFFHEALHWSSVALYNANLIRR